MMSAATIPPIPLQAIIMPTTEASKGEFLVQAVNNDE